MCLQAPMSDWRRRRGLYRPGGVYVDLNAIFPIHDAASAHFMQFKAHCLLRAGIISAAQKSEVDAAAARAIMQAFGGAAESPGEKCVAWLRRSRDRFVGNNMRHETN
jgi:hypothetical protein